MTAQVDLLEDAEGEDFLENSVRDISIATEYAPIPEEDNEFSDFVGCTPVKVDEENLVFKAEVNEEDFHISSEDLDIIRETMAKITLPTPKWALNIPEDEWLPRIRKGIEIAKAEEDKRQNSQ